MLDGIKTEFSIRDLENLSGVKAHTIRMWEKRYELLEPKRTDSNIRLYDITGLRKLLNTSWLLQQGYRISKVAGMSEDEINLKIREGAVNTVSNDLVTNQLKLAMLDFDEQKFNHVLDRLELEMSFREIFVSIFIPFLDNVGRWWMTDVIRPAHEHFVSNLIRQKLMANIEKASRMERQDTTRMYVLFTPINEIHDLGLLYAHYEILLRGIRSVYLGQSVPINDLALVEHTGMDCTYVCSATIRPETEHINYFLFELHQKLVKSEREHLVLFGQKIQPISELPELPQTQYFEGLHDFIRSI